MMLCVYVASAYISINSVHHSVGLKHDGHARVKRLLPTRTVSGLSIAKLSIAKNQKRVWLLNESIRFPPMMMTCLICFSEQGFCSDGRWKFCRHFEKSGWRRILVESRLVRHP